MGLTTPHARGVFPLVARTRSIHPHDGSRLFLASLVFSPAPGFVVLSQRKEDGEFYVLVETTATLAGCPSCGVKATGHGRSVVEVRDLPAGGRPVRLVWRKRRWLCTDPDCDAKSFTEQTPEIEGSLTRRAATAFS